MHLIANQDNRGFARANNQAIRQATGRFVFILNPDTIVQPQAMQTLVRFLEEHPDAGMVGPRQIGVDGVIVEAAARRLLTLSAVFWIGLIGNDRLPKICPRLYRRLMAPYDFAVTQEVEATSGAMMLLPREFSAVTARIRRDLRSQRRRPRSLLSRPQGGTAHLLLCRRDDHPPSGTKQQAIDVPHRRGRDIEQWRILYSVSWKVARLVVSLHVSGNYRAEIHNHGMSEVFHRQAFGPRIARIVQVCRVFADVAGTDVAIIVLPLRVSKTPTTQKMNAPVQSTCAHR